MTKIIFNNDVGYGRYHNKQVVSVIDEGLDWYQTIHGVYVPKNIVSIHNEEDFFAE